MFDPFEDSLDDLIGMHSDEQRAIQVARQDQSAPLARLETAIALSRLLDRRDRIELAGDPPNWRTNLLGRAVESLEVRLA